MNKIVICLLSGLFALMYNGFDIMSYVLGAVLGMLYMGMDIMDR